MTPSDPIPTGLTPDPSDISDVSVFYLHGLESSPHGTKYRALAERIDIRAYDYSDFDAKRDIQGRVAKGISDLEHEDKVFLIGSSFGGLMAALMYQEIPEKIVGMVLLAPAFTFSGAEAIKNLGDHTVIVHGKDDEVIPYEDIVLKAENLRAPLITVDDSHRLHESLDLIADVVQDTLQTAQASLKS